MKIQDAIKIFGALPQAAQTLTPDGKKENSCHIVAGLIVAGGIGLYLYWRWKLKKELEKQMAAGAKV